MEENDKNIQEIKEKVNELIGSVVYRINEYAREPIIPMDVIGIYINQRHHSKQTFRIDCIGKHDMDESSCCISKDYLRTGINGRVINNPPERKIISRNGCCKHWVDAESGHTKFEVLTGYKEPYDGTKVDFSVSQISMFSEMEK